MDAANKSNKNIFLFCSLPIERIFQQLSLPTFLTIHKRFSLTAHYTRENLPYCSMVRKKSSMHSILFLFFLLLSHENYSNFEILITFSLFGWTFFSLLHFIVHALKKLNLQFIHVQFPISATSSCVTMSVQTFNFLLSLSGWGTKGRVLLDNDVNGWKTFVHL